MKDSLYIALQYIRYHRKKSLVLIACVVLISALPLIMQLLFSESERQLMARADATPLVIGSKGSALDLVMNTLYFSDEHPEPISMAAANRIDDSGLALPIPVYARFTARNLPIVGTSLDYFEFRNLQVAAGRPFGFVGECVLGAAAADKLELQVGDSLVSSPETVFNIAGIYPLKMKIVGVLSPSYTADDLAVFTDIKTTWIIQGLGHGHQDVTRLTDPTLVLSRSGGNVAATAKLYQYNEITEQNMDSFHFHGDTSVYPLSAVIAAPYDSKSGTILRGRFLGKDEQLQIVKPSETITRLLETIFRIKNVLDAVVLIDAIATLLALVLDFTLSQRLRSREVETIFRIGCSRLTIA